MSEKDCLVTLFGKAAEMLVRLAALVRQIMKQGGQAEDINMLNDDRVLKRVAKVLASAGNLKRPFSVSVEGKTIDIHLIGLTTKLMIDVEQGLPGKNVWRLAKAEELFNLALEHLGFLDEEDGLLIISERVDDDGDSHCRWLLSEKRGHAYKQWFKNNERVPRNCLFAVVAVEPEQLKLAKNT